MKYQKRGKKMNEEITVRFSLRKLFTKYMFLIGLTGQLLYYLQAYDIFNKHSARDISLWGFVINFIALVSWVIYGLQIKNRILVIVSTVGCFGSFLVILGTWYYGY